MEISAHYALTTFDHKGIPFIYVVHASETPISRASLALNIVEDGSMERRPPNSLVRLYLDNKVTIEAGYSPAVKKHLSSHPRGMIAILDVSDIKGFELALKERLAHDISYSIRREQELTLTPEMRAQMKEGNKRIDAFMSCNRDFLDDAIRRKWLKKLTGLLLIEGEQKLINSEMIPKWAKTFINKVNVIPLTIVDQEIAIYNNS